MSIKVNLRVLRGIMPRSGVLHNPLHIFVDDNIVEDIGWGRKTTLTLPAGKHSIYVADKKGYRPYNLLTIDAADGATVNLFCYLDTQNGQLTTINKADTAAINSIHQKIPWGGGSYHSASVAHQNAIGTVYFVGILTLIIGIVVQFSDYLDGLGINSTTMIVLGVVFIVLGFFVQRKSIIALILSILIYTWDMVGIILILALGNILMLGSLAMHIIFLISMIKGIGAIIKLKKEPASQANSQGANDVIEHPAQTDAKQPAEPTTQSPNKQFCYHCGRPLLADEKFCPVCGNAKRD